MKEIAWSGLVDRSGWARGPWDRELADKVQWPDGRTGLPCLAVRSNQGIWCGYVGVPEGHPAFGVRWRGLSGLKVHRGVDYSGVCSGHICHITEEAEHDLVWWLGFATSLDRDVNPSGAAWWPARYGTTEQRQYRSLAYIKEQCGRLAAQLADLARGRHVPQRMREGNR